MRRLLGGVMALLIVAGAAGGFFAVGRIRGWFPSSQAEEVEKHPLALRAEVLAGAVLVQRKGVSYQLKDGESLQTGDQVTLKGHGSATLTGEGCKVRCGEGSAFLVGETEGGDPQLTLTGGALFGHCETALCLVVGNQLAQVDAGTVSLTVTGEALTLDMFSGDVRFTGGDSAAVSLSPGERVSVPCDGGRWGAPVRQTLALADLSDFSLACAVEYDGLWMTPKELRGEIRRREKAAQAALEAELKEQNEKETVEKQEEPAAEELPEQSEAAESSASSEKEEQEKKAEAEQAARATEKKKRAAEEKRKAEEQKKAEGQQKADSSEKKEEEPATESGGSCTIYIECKTLLDHMDELKESKRGYVPSDGVILKKTTVSFCEGETVYDVLVRTCKAAGVQLEVSYSGGYGSYYVEGIGHLYEFDCGRQSGWVYTVNGTSPKYGCSSCKLQDGDRIVWSYTCQGLGSDVR